MRKRFGIQMHERVLVLDPARSTAISASKALCIKGGPLQKGQTASHGTLRHGETSMARKSCLSRSSASRKDPCG